MLFFVRLEAMANVFFVLLLSSEVVNLVFGSSSSGPLPPRKIMNDWKISIVEGGQVFRTYYIFFSNINTTEKWYEIKALVRLDMLITE